MDERGHRRGAGHGVRQPDIERDLRGFAGGADEQQQADGQGNGRFQQVDIGLERKVVKSLRANGPEQKGHAEDEAEVADAVDDEGLVAGQHIATVFTVIADEQIRAQTNTLPADEHDDRTVSEHQHEHAAQEQVHVGEEFAVVPVPPHIPDGVDVDEGTDQGDKQQHQAAERVGEKSHVDVQIAHAEPGESVLRQIPGFGWQRLEGEEHLECENKRQDRSDTGKQSVELLGKFAPVAGEDMQESDDDCSQQRKKRDQT